MAAAGLAKSLVVAARVRNLEHAVKNNRVVGYCEVSHSTMFEVSRMYGGRLGYFSVTFCLKR